MEGQVPDFLQKKLVNQYGEEKKKVENLEKSTVGRGIWQDN